MAILSGSILISSLSLLHLTVAYFLYTSPVTVARHGMVLVLSNAFQLPVSPTFLVSSAATTLLGLVFGFVAVTDLFAAALPEEIGMFYWGAQAPVRAGFFFLLTAWAWAGGPKGLDALAGKGANQANARGPAPGFVYGPVSDGLIFTWSFVETLLWFWVGSLGSR